MLTTQPRSSSPHRTLGWLSVLTALGASLFGCPDALRLDPNGSSTSSSSSGGEVGGAGGGGTGTPCISNTDCPLPAPVCDAVKRQCFECLVASDCAPKAGTVCSKGACVCPDVKETFCAAADQQPNRCVNTMGALNDCGACGHVCVNGCSGGVCSDGWSQITMTSAPDPRAKHVAVWDDADKLMVVWGGMNPKPLATGGIYDPTKNTWAATSMTGAPSERSSATAVWDDADGAMIVWGGADAGNGPLNTGAIFDPKANTWKPITTTGAPAARYFHTAVWNSSAKAMIVWGGTDGSMFLDSGASYDPTTDTWKPLMTGLTGRYEHTAVWSGTSMIVFGGFGSDGAVPPVNGPLNDGSSYDPTGDSWNPSAPGAGTPSVRYRHTAVWTGASMMVFGGNTTGNMVVKDGGRLKNGSWTAFDAVLEPEPRQYHTAVWIPATSEMIVWGGQAVGAPFYGNGYRINESSLTWAPIAPAITGRAHHTAVVAGAQMIVWGGQTGPGAFTSTGGIFDATVK